MIAIIDVIIAKIERNVVLSFVDRCSKLYNDCNPVTSKYA